ncbi:prolyl oligopeptidase family serine peptidase [Maritimibacter sp. UBA3975]|uniref:alpha/beta hydrolase n=1 Tax=Maritimibacter sp. UBA3975 TaxID=1946833 RepID=UPI000C0A9C2A|nr:prolyl oligopeptidase family serine peptidase [Maritimibacter sp. UBA3975]MAM60333.1 phospholipase [Maritimibacter sp.]|tara:strand:- start:10806 stop:11483 length:678 start_codon:yes stop_codon:yes gene_type:complete
MARELAYKKRDAASGTADSVVVFLHGYGADGADLLGLADPLSDHMPDTAFYAPDAPEKCSGNPFGFQWFPIPWLDGSSEEAATQGAARAHEDIDAFLDKVLAETGLTPDRMIVFGFSQGTMMSLRVVPQRDAEVAGIVAFSGRILETETYGEAVKVRPPVLLVHGDADEMVPVAHFQEAGQVLQDAGFTVYGHVQEGTGHGIAPDGLSVALSFMADRLGIAPKAS